MNPLAVCPRSCCLGDVQLAYQIGGVPELCLKIGTL